MKKLFKTMAIVACAFFGMTVASCSGGSTSDSSLFGSVPEVYEKFMKEKAELDEKAKNIKSEEDKAKLIAESKKMEEKWQVKIEEAAKAVDGKEINLTEGEFKVTSPISLTFTGKCTSQLEPRFDVNGEAVTAEELRPNAQYITYFVVNLVGYDAEGNEVFANSVGSIEGKADGNNCIIEAGTPVKFTTLLFNDRDIEGYEKATTLKLAIKDK